MSLTDWICSPPGEPAQSAVLFTIASRDRTRNVVFRERVLPVCGHTVDRHPEPAPKRTPIALFAEGSPSARRLKGFWNGEPASPAALSSSHHLAQAIASPGIAAASASLVPRRPDHAKEAVDGHAWRVGPRVKEELVRLAALRCAVAEFQVPQAGDGDRCAVRVV